MLSLEYGIVYLFCSDGVVYDRRGIRTWPVLILKSIIKEDIFLRFSNVGSFNFFSIAVILLVNA